MYELMKFIPGFGYFPLLLFILGLLGIDSLLDCMEFPLAVLQGMQNNSFCQLRAFDSYVKENLFYGIMI